MNTIEYFAGLGAVLSRDAFLSHLPGPGVLIRLDDRGGKDEPAPWAFQNVTRTIPRPFEPEHELDAEQIRNVLNEVTEVSTSSANSNVFTNAPEDEITNTMTRPAQALPVPDARGAAHVHTISGENQKAVVGRAPTAEINIQEMSISKNHARFTWTNDGAVRLLELGSSNGTKVNQHVLQSDEPRTLASGDQVFFGDIHFLYLDRNAFHTHLPDFMD